MRHFANKIVVLYLIYGLIITPHLLAVIHLGVQKSLPPSSFCTEVLEVHTFILIHYS